MFTPIVLKILTIVKTTHAQTVHHAWMASTDTHASARQDSLDAIAKLVSRCLTHWCSVRFPSFKTRFLTHWTLRYLGFNSLIYQGRFTVFKIFFPTRDKLRFALTGIKDIFHHHRKSFAEFCKGNSDYLEALSPTGTGGVSRQIQLVARMPFELGSSTYNPMPHWTTRLRGLPSFEPYFVRIINIFMVPFSLKISMTA